MHDSERVKVGLFLSEVPFERQGCSAEQNQFRFLTFAWRVCGKRQYLCWMDDVLRLIKEREISDIDSTCNKRSQGTEHGLNLYLKWRERERELSLIHI